PCLLEGPPASPAPASRGERTSCVVAEGEMPWAPLPWGLAGGRRLSGEAIAVSAAGAGGPAFDVATAEGVESNGRGLDGPWGPPLVAGAAAPLRCAAVRSPPLGWAPVGSLPLGGTAVGSPPLGCAAVGSPPLGCAAVGWPPLGCAAVGSPPLGCAAVGWPPLGCAAVGWPPLGCAAVGWPPLGCAAVGWPPLGCTAVGWPPLGCTAVGSLSGPRISEPLAATTSADAPCPSAFAALSPGSSIPVATGPDGPVAATSPEVPRKDAGSA